MAYAIIRTGGKQYKVAAGDVISVEKLGVAEGASTTISDVIFYADGSDIKASADALKGASVAADVLRHRKDKKITAYKYKRRKGYHRKVGHRRQLTDLKITGISF